MKDVSGWSSRTAPRQLPAAAETSASPCSRVRASSSLRAMDAFIAASSALRSSSACQAASAFASSVASRASARRPLAIALFTARSACERTR
ncbi:hypothetical protein SGLAM104S_09585 [Streptomyces glaucescens]